MTAHGVAERPRQADEPQLLGEDIRLLWDFQKIIFIPEHVDFVLAVGCKDERWAALPLVYVCRERQLTSSRLEGLERKRTIREQSKTAHRFANIARTMGVPHHLILEESKATNEFAHQDAIA